MGKKNIHKIVKQIKKKVKVKIPLFQGDYGFIDIKNMPYGTYTSKCISLEDCDWATTGEFIQNTNNHCGAVASTNIALFYAYQGYIGLLINTSKSETFYKIHKSIGNGPVIRIAAKTKNYFKSRGYDLNYRRVTFYKGIKEAIDKNRPCAILLTAGIAKWHWVIGVGYREYTTGERYIQVVNGWRNSSNQFFKVGDGAKIVSVTEYWIN
ncbi:MAG: hypothetical protein GX323_01740 [Clostridiales bacterium]|nr:hypothetical protein [Clostridiales bacterium]